MAKNTKGGKKQVKVKELPKAEKKLAAKDMKKVRGGDFNNDGVVDSADYVIARKANIIQKVH